MSLPADDSSHTPPRWMSRSERFLAVASALLAICAIVVVIGLTNLSRAHDAVMAEFVHTRAARAATYGLMQASIDMETGQRGYLLTGDQSFLEPFEAGQSAADVHLARLRELAADAPDLQARVGRIEALHSSAVGGLSTTLGDYRRGGQTRAELREALRASKVLIDELRAENMALLRSVEQSAARLREEERESSDALYWSGGILAILTLLAVGLTVFALRTERRSWHAAFAALSQARARAAASDLAKTRFLAVASHDMRQPLHAITLYLSALQRRVDNPEAREIIAKMDHATQSMVAMFSTLLDAARMQAGVVHPEITVFPLQPVIDRILAEHPGGKISAAPTQLNVRSDEVLLERTLRNLVSNAIKHGGGEARIEVAEHGERIEIAVVDSGPGIPEEERERIFEEFVRLEGRAEGLGLGLSIVKRTSDMLDMRVRVETAQSGGARFVIEQPSADGDAPAQAQHVEDTSIAGAKVLVMDDDELARGAISGAMRDMGAVVHECANGADVERAIAGGFQPALLLMDLRIDGQLQGIDIAHRARAGLSPPPPVMILTGDTAADTLSLLRASGFAWLIKPVDPRELHTAAAAQLRG